MTAFSEDPRRRYIVACLPRPSPLCLTLQTYAQCLSDIKWQVVGHKKAADFLILKLVDGKFHDDTGTPVRVSGKGWESWAFDNFIAECAAAIH